ncbi:MAG: hypothetical protein LVQ95_00155 [Candidatus Micrarchaeales archaeon]|nr:hypothetical protein [Candidatus Micrarchaeales archaeon]
MGTSKPFSFDALGPYYYLLSQEREQAAVEKIGLNFKNPKKVSIDPGQIRSLLITALLYGKIFRLKKKRYMKVVNFYRKILEAYSPEDPFSYHGTNKMYNKEEVSRITKRLKWQQNNPEALREVNKLLASLASITYAIYNDFFPCLGREFHGPYDVSKAFGKGTCMISRDYFNIKPTHLWKHCKNYKYKSVNVLGIYRNLKIKFDFWGNYISLDDMNRKLLYYAVIVDGKQASTPKRIKEISEYLAKKTVEQVRRVDRMSFEQTKLQFQKMAESFFKEMYDAAGIDWRPTREMKEKIKGKKLLKHFTQWAEGRIITPKEIKRGKRILDPRINIHYDKKVPE